MKATKTVINGEPYTITSNGFGWKVTNTTSRINNIGRSYQVFPSKATGKPERCSCPHQTHKGAYCKHMTEVARLLKADVTPEPNPEPKVTPAVEVSSHSLEHPGKPRLYRFGVLSNGTVRYERWEGSVMTSCIVLPVEEARGRYSWLLRSGYSTFGYVSREVDRKPYPGK